MGVHLWNAISCPVFVDALDDKLKKIITNISHRSVWGLKNVCACARMKGTMLEEINLASRNDLFRVGIKKKEDNILNAEKTRCARNLLTSSIHVTQLKCASNTYCFPWMDETLRTINGWKAYSYITHFWIYP